MVAHVKACVLMSAVSHVLIAGIIPLVHGEERATEILSRAYVSASNIDSIRFTSAVSSEAGEQCYEFIGKQQKYRVNCYDGTTSPAQVPDTIEAFDGNHYQRFLEDLGIYGRSSTFGGSISTPFPSPFVWCYLWLFQEGDTLEMGRIKDRAVWDRAIQSARFKESYGEEGNRLHVVEMTTTTANVEYIYSVAFSEQLSWFPLKWESFVKTSGALAGSATTNEYRVINQDATTIVVPLSVSVSITGADAISRKREASYTIAEESLRVNQPVDDNVFTLNPARAEILIDGDRVREDIERRRQSVATKATPGRMWPGLALVVIAFITILYLAKGAVKRRRSNN